MLLLLLLFFSNPHHSGVMAACVGLTVGAKPLSTAAVVFTIRRHRTRLSFPFDCVAGVRSENMTEPRRGNATLKGHAMRIRRGGKGREWSREGKKKTIDIHTVLFKSLWYVYVDGSHVGPFWVYDDPIVLNACIYTMCMCVRVCVCLYEGTRKQNENNSVCYSLSIFTTRTKWHSYYEH